MFAKILTGLFIVIIIILIILSIKKLYIDDNIYSRPITIMSKT